MKGERSTLRRATREGETQRPGVCGVHSEVLDSCLVGAEYARRLNGAARAVAGYACKGRPGGRPLRGLVKSAQADFAGIGRSFNGGA